MHTKRTRVAVAAALAVTLLTSGCIGGLSSDGSLDAAAVGDYVEQRHAALDGYSADVTRTVAVGDETSTVSATVDVERGERQRVTYTDGPRAGETVARSTDAGPVFDAALGADGPATPARFGDLAEELVRANNVTLERVTVVDARRTAVLELTPRSNASAADLTRTVWVDLERNVPTRVETSWTTADGRSATVTVAYDDVTLVENESASAEVPA
ncbi:LolA family protein [Halobacterium yunchengense]|uniref:LolA family protein n=1 Tax=Halobacterium yunchengense TaxID=3108497 RepID=UPI003008BCE3